jgi:hypothetical protein
MTFVPVSWQANSEAMLIILFGQHVDSEEAYEGTLWETAKSQYETLLIREG